MNDNPDDPTSRERERLREMFNRAFALAEISPTDKALIAERIAAGDKVGAECLAENALKRAVIEEVEAMRAASQL